jgi:hypothetical protein
MYYTIWKGEAELARQWARSVGLMLPVMPNCALVLHPEPILEGEVE